MLTGEEVMEIRSGHFHFGNGMKPGARSSR